MSLTGDVSRVNCDVTPGTQGLSVQLFKLVCNYDGSDAEADYSRGSLLAAQRRAEIEMINEMLMTDPAYIGWDYTSFAEDSIVILDCPRANGGICVVNAWSDTYVHITSFRPTKPSSRDEILIQPGYFLENQGTAAAAQGEPREEVLKAAMMIRQSRFIFDHPEVKASVVEAVSTGAGILYDLLFHND